MTSVEHSSRTRGLDAAALPPLARLPEEWGEVLAGLGQPRFRAQQVFRWLHQRGEFDVERMSNVSKVVREHLTEAGPLLPLGVEGVQRSSDGTRKLLLRLADGKLIECVIIPMTREAESNADVAALDLDSDADDEVLSGSPSPVEGEAGAPPRQRVTLCVSTQVGCAMGCVFCASGQAGLKRGLGAHEVLAQVLLAKRYLDSGEYLRNLVFMGMGEPLHHYDETARAIRLLTHPEGIGMSLRRLTVSSVGLIPGIRRLGEDFGGKVGLAISLHAPNHAVRSQIIPMNERFPFEDLLAALRAYPLPARRRITIEYTLIDGLNDSLDHAEELARSLGGLRVKVNLIPMNPIGASSLRPPSRERVEAFQRRLGQHRVSCSVRQRRGDDVDAACGQLALRRHRDDAPAEH